MPRTIAVLVFLTLVFVPLQADPVAPVVGFYAVAGVNPDGSKYALEVSIQENNNTEIAGLLFVSNGNLMAQGLAFRTGNVLSMIFLTSEGATGLSQCSVKGKDRMECRWLVPGLGIGTEVFTRIAKPTPPTALKRPPVVRVALR